jgi:hypothetical protein
MGNRKGTRIKRRQGWFNHSQKAPIILDCPCPCHLRHYDLIPCKGGYKMALCVSCHHVQLHDDIGYNYSSMTWQLNTTSSHSGNPLIEEVTSTPPPPLPVFSVFNTRVFRPLPTTYNCFPIATSLHHIGLKLNLNNTESSPLHLENLKSIQCGFAFLTLRGCLLMPAHMCSSHLSVSATIH